MSRKSKRIYTRQSNSARDIGPSLDTLINALERPKYSQMSLASPSIVSPSLPSTRNPVSLRLYKVLGASFDDEGTKQALRTLSELYDSSTKSESQPRNDRGLSDGDEDAHIAVLSGIPSYLSDNCPSHGTVPGEIAARARKNLRRDVENKLTEASQKFLRAFGEVDRQLDTLQEHLAAMRLHCDEAENQLEETNESCKSLLEHAGSLRNERQAVTAKQSIVSLFLSRFTLTEEEVEAMISRDVPIGQRFFSAMDKTENIRQDCQVLMAGEEGPTQAGLDIMTATSSYMEQAYEKIFRWCSYEFRQMAREVQIEVTPTIREGVNRLRQRTELLNEALATLSQSRQATLLSAFTDALTRGGRGGLPRPIELHAHDPMRYVGDMLAWVHQGIAAEREFLESLFGIKSDGRMVGSVRKFETNEDEEWIKELMDAAMSKLCVPLKVRVQQTIRSQESSIMSFKIANLLQFYMLTMQRTIGGDTILCQTLKEITDVSYKAFFDSTAAQGRSLLRTSLDLDDTELTPPLVVQDHGQVLREIMVVYESSLLEDESIEGQIVEFRPIVDAMLDPAVEMCLTASEEKQKARPLWDKQVFVLNCLAYIKSAIEPFAFTSEKQGFLDQLIEGKVLSLIEDHYKNILRDTGLEEVVAACASHEDNEPLSRLPATQPSQLQMALKKFSAWLSDLEVVHSPRLAKLVAQQLHTKIHQAALERLAKADGNVCEEVKNPSNKYEAASTLLGSERPFGQMRLLWQIFGLQDVGE